MEYLLVRVRVDGTDLTLLMPDWHYNAVKDWLFEANRMTVESVEKAADKGVTVK